MELVRAFEERIPGVHPNADYISTELAKVGHWDAEEHFVVVCSNSAGKHEPHRPRYSECIPTVKRVRFAAL